MPPCLHMRVLEGVDMSGWDVMRCVNLNAAPHRRTSDGSWSLAWGEGRGCPFAAISIACYVLSCVAGVLWF